MLRIRSTTCSTVHTTHHSFNYYNNVITHITHRLQVIKQKLKGIMAWINQRSHSQSSETNPVSAEVQDKDNEDYDNNYDNVCIALSIHY